MSCVTPLPGIPARVVVDVNSTMVEAARAGKEHILLTCKDWGGENYDGMLRAAAEGGHEGIMWLAREWGATKFDEAASAANEAGNSDLAQLCLGWIREENRST